jgi:hypothetical protein
MKGKSVFYLCLWIAIIFFALGNLSYLAMFAFLSGIGIGIGLYFGKFLLFAGIVFFVFWSLFRKRK